MYMYMTVSQNSGPILRKTTALTKTFVYNGDACKYIVIRGPPIYLHYIYKRPPCIQSFFVRGRLFSQNSL